MNVIQILSQAHYTSRLLNYFQLHLQEIIMTKTVINQGHLTVWWIREFPVPVNWTRALKVGKAHWKGKDRNNCMTLIHLVQGSRTQIGLRQLLVLSSNRRANTAVRYYNKLQYFWKCFFFHFHCWHNNPKLQTAVCIHLYMISF